MDKTIVELKKELADREASHRLEMRTLRAYIRAREAQEAAEQLRAPKLPAGATQEIPSVHGSNR